MKDVMTFIKKGKLSPYYVSPYQILRRVGKVAYKLKLHCDLALVYLVFIFVEKCVGDQTSIVPFKSLGLKESLSYEEVPIEILDRQVRKLRNREVPFMKVRCRNQLVNGST
ncbi:hypothetical protein MTR67_018370 [Solanum verrucosum]|uniref:Tf2-1-like SH3-like domain-containing protein n=1 Tax=Solanum verrucosum TaxID=315347 RepID=A0AAF0TSZ7_SOLVR|nr:hypothetical protein MTR67_018370 [Solanum verrucosum]